jgi:ATP-dependent DNA helicase RecG
MDLQDVKVLSAKKETKTVEFKSSTALLRAVFETLCAFLNNKGGVVLIGVRDDGKIVGQQISDNTRKDISKEIKKIEPAAQIDVDYIEIESNKFVISIRVNPGEHAPYTYDGRSFQREESETNRMSQHRYEQLLIKRGQLNHSWEETVAAEYCLDDLDHEEIYKTVSDGIRENRIPASAQREDVQKILERLGLMVGDKLKRAAVVLYAKQESIKFLQCMIKMARFKGADKLGDFIDNQQIAGNAFKILFDADAFLRRHLPIASFFKFDQFKRIDKPALPVMAIREALINSISHRDYSDRHTDISMAIYDDRLEIWNSGRLLKNLTLENLKHEHESVLRNKLIANAFYVRGWIEKWGSGTNRMLELCKADVIPEPMFLERTGGLAVIFKFAKPIDTRKELLGPVDLTMRQVAILSYIKKVKVASLPQISNHLTSELPETPVKRTIIRDLNYLKSCRLINVEGQKRSAVWVPLGVENEAFLSDIE